MIARVTAEFVFHFLQECFLFHGADAVDTVTLLAMADGNTRQLATQPDLNRQYFAPGQSVPRDLLAPISIGAVARSTGLPFETTRRRIHRMAELGYCHMDARGVVFATDQLDTRQAQATMERQYVALSLLHREIREGAPDFVLVNPAVPAGERLERPARLCTRVVASQILRYIDSVRPITHDLISASIVLAVGVLGNDGETDPQIRLERRRRDGLLTDQERRPVNASQLARALAASRETLRRRLAKLVDSGTLAMREKGYILPLSYLQSAESELYRRQRAVFVTQLFTALHRLGVRFDDEA